MRIFIVILLLTISFQIKSQDTIILNASKQIILSTDTCYLSSHPLKWIFNDNSVILLDEVTQKLTIFDSIKKIELRNDDEYLVTAYLRGDVKYATIYNKKYGLFLGITDMLKWDYFDDMLVDKCFYPIAAN